jgi:hypothetical protein
MSDAYRDYLLAELRCAFLRAQLLQNDVAAIGIALKGGLINEDIAVEQLSECGVLRLVARATAGAA